ncbi:VanZ family protein [Vibrio tapetis]|uniref:VanZ-like domain-containing protein n=1 Tax=Vibrio tapetis subsp. tapetis TaxID=1671868 RepID=A0A2N8Z8T5_9VIBR|nr:VanZ family protein [Vibrio tapetis]SON48306.1 conserved membrane protein of unknown function [Vibrio tapetis subsp. tapetis]
MKIIDIIIRYWAALVMVLGLTITYLSLSPIQELPSVPGTDKTHHFIAYAALMFPIALRKPKHWKIYGAVLIGYSGVIELIQPYMNRHGEWLDMLANTSGVIIGIFLATLVNFLVNQIRMNKSRTNVKNAD